MSVAVASPTVVSNRPSWSRAARRTTAVVRRAKEELRSSRRSASFGSKYRSRRNRCSRRCTPSRSTCTLWIIGDGPEREHLAELLAGSGWRTR